MSSTAPGACVRGGARVRAFAPAAISLKASFRNARARRLLELAVKREGITQEDIVQAYATLKTHVRAIVGE
jgi:hypothetical protein